MIDDIDRLKPEEIDNVFKLFRITDNMKNIITILSFDPEIIKKYNRIIVNGGLENESAD